MPQGAAVQARPYETKYGMDKRAESSYNSYLQGAAFYQSALPAYVPPAEPEIYDDPEPDYAPEPRRIPNTGKKVKPAKKSRIKPIFEFAQRFERGTSPMTYLLVIFVFAAAMVSLVAFAVKAGEINSLNSLQASYRKIHDENAIIQSDIYKSYSLAEIDRICREELGMSEPKEHQKRYITVPDEGYVVQYDIGAKGGSILKFDFGEALDTVTSVFSIFIR